MMLSPKDLLQRLVQIPSVNPAFHSGESSISGEYELTEFLQNFLENLGLATVRQQVHPQRENLFAVFPSEKPHSEGGPILWEVHQDTVGVQGMKIDPFGGLEAEGRIWGRGACDVKGAMAAMLTALARLRAEQAAPRENLIVAFTINEESGFSGVKALARLWDAHTTPDAETDKTASLRGNLAVDELRALRPTRALVAEPTLLDVVVTHKGCIRWRCHTHGKAAHTSSPELGSNAISTMMRVVQAIERYQTEVLNSKASHPRCGRPTICVSTIQGGSGVNTVPDHAVIDIDYRLMPGDEPEAAREEVIEYLAKTLSDDADNIEHELPSNQCAGLREDGNKAWAQTIASTVASVTGVPSSLIGVPYGTDAWVLDSLGIPTVVFGPGSIEQAHTEDEWIATDQLERAAEIFYQLAIGC